jgi:hypothetical protein
MKTYKIIGKTNSYIAQRSAIFNGKTEIVLEEGLLLDEAWQILLTYFNKDFGTCYHNWGLVRCNYPHETGTRADGTRFYEYDSRTYSIEEMDEVTEVVKALQEVSENLCDGWAIPTNDKGSGAAGVNFLGTNDVELIEKYIDKAIFNPNAFEYIPASEFGDEEEEIVAQMMSYPTVVAIEREEVAGLIVSHEQYEGNDYTFYIANISE